MEDPAGSKLLRVPEVAARLDVTVARAWSLCRNGALPTVRIGRQYRVDAEALQAWIDGGGRPLSEWTGRAEVSE